MAKKNDLRVKRTQKMIVEAFIRLVNEKGYDNLTIQDIADEAMINRATFYAHFKDKPDLYDHIFNFALTAFTSVLNPEQLVQGNRIKVKNIEFVLTKIYTEIQKNKNFFLMIMDTSSNERLRQRLAEILYDTYDDLFQKLRITENDIEVPIDFIVEYMTSIFTGTLHWWLTSETEMSANHLARLVIKLIGNGHLTVLGIEIEK
ncbi:AcrR family transcriptional regulator [Enterococcus sp. PF1-24]|uniref:TetR/AcrR family transcriptional regulator n=1 Tax=unclassified Enterococcus TaxID=2608891 RepID=UPI0024748630|nr:MULTISPECIES: TetR/AcrR family transcriptional regulator [unclassified Enterococcus]MDH6364746.1 AcrR family transcriptional regulator [Enterococcus sp. PFB1-1]MDH6401778.1 AcrR family transcriptional regulator [Enterococcus sp. PF1-24]